MSVSSLCVSHTVAAAAVVVKKSIFTSLVVWFFSLNFITSFRARTTENAREVERK